MLNINYQPPEKLFFFYSQKARYKVALGGRGSGKSWAVADALVLKAIEKFRTVSKELDGFGFSGCLVFSSLFFD